MPPSDSFDALVLVNSRVEGLERRVDLMDAELTQNVQRASDTHHAVVTLTSQVGQMTETFRDFRNALYGVAVIILASAVLVVLLGHP
jgi:tetrahydromethanopterin S-methyltransferase subunit G